MPFCEHIAVCSPYQTSVSLTKVPLSLSFVSYSIVANYLYRTYPKLRVSYLSAIRQRLVQNATLAKFAKLYKMDQALVMGSGAENMRYDMKSKLCHKSVFIGNTQLTIGLFQPWPIPLKHLLELCIKCTACS